MYSNIGINKYIDVLVGADYRRQGTDQEYLALSSFGPLNHALGDSASVNQVGLYAAVLLKGIAGFSALVVKNGIII